jgi:hypothetical protein
VQEILLEIVLDVVGEVIGIILEPLLATISLGRVWPDILNSRIFWSVIIVVLAGIICWELR